MIPNKPNLETAVPRTLETRLEIAKAVQALAAQDDGERLRQRRAEIASIRRELEESRATFASCATNGRC